MFEHHKLIQSKNNRAIWLNGAPLSYSVCVHEGLNEHFLGWWTGKCGSKPWPWQYGIIVRRLTRRSVVSVKNWCLFATYNHGWHQACNSTVSHLGTIQDGIQMRHMHTWTTITLNITNSICKLSEFVFSFVVCSNV